jgi:hypothetical protein
MWRAPAEAKKNALSAMSSGRDHPPLRLRPGTALVTAGAISQRIAKAEQAGLVVRSHAADGSRAVLIALTAAGHELIERTVDRVLSREAQLVTDLDPDRALRWLASLTGCWPTSPAGSPRQARPAPAARSAALGSAFACVAAPTMGSVDQCQ